MRSAFLCLLSLIVGIAAGLVLSVTFFNSTPAPSIQSTPSSELNEELPNPAQDETVLSVAPVSTPDLTSNQVLLNRAFQVLSALQEENYATLSAFVHPKKGVTFTPYSTVDETANLNFSAAQISDAAEDTELYIWGITDGQGTPIKMKMTDYFAQYVYNADYAQAPQIGVDQIMASGNSTENVTESYPDGRFVEFHFPGLDPKLEGFDWCSLKLVFEVFGSDFKLVGIIHSQWTI